MLWSARLVLAIAIGLFIASCGGLSCDDLVDAALACPYSGYTDDNVDALRGACETGSTRLDACQVDAYTDSCASEDELISASWACLE